MNLIDKITNNKKQMVTNCLPYLNNLYVPIGKKPSPRDHESNKYLD